MIVEEARERGLRHFFGLPGGGSPLDMMDAGQRRGLEFVTVAHESSAAITASAYGAMAQTAGLAVGIKGVGAGNLAAGAVNAYFERAPVVCLCDRASTKVTQREMVQHLDHCGLFGAFTKFEDILSAEGAAASLQEAVYQATDGRPGPVLLDLPGDAAGEECEGPLPVKAPPTPTRPDEAKLVQVREMLGKSRRPLVIAGSDVIRAGAMSELAQLVEGLGAAILVNMDARGVYPESSPRWAGVLLGNFTPNLSETEIMAQADCILLVGVDAMMSHDTWSSDLPTCELVARAAYETLSPDPAIRVDADLKQAIGSLLSVQQSGFPEDEIQTARQTILRNFARPGGARFAAHDILEIARAALPEDGMMISETGAHACMLEQLWPVDRPGLFRGTSGGRTMGLMVPFALGARLAQPELPMIGVGGDGSLLMRLGELEAFARTGAAMPLVILNDQALGTIKSRQRSRGLPEYSLGIHPIDYAALARAMGLRGVEVSAPEEFEKELAAAMSADRATLIDCRIDARAYQDSFGPTIGVLD